MNTVALGELIRSAAVVRAGNGNYPLLSMTMHDGLVNQSAKFKKRVASDDVSSYKVIRRGQLVVGFPIDEGVLDFQDLYSHGIVSPAYGVWDLCDQERVDADYLKKFLRSGPALAYYKGKLRGSTARRRSLPAEVFLALPVPLPPLREQRRIAEILDRADALRTKRRQVLTQLDALTQSIFSAMFGDPNDWPGVWPIGTIGDLATSVNYGTAGKAGAVGEWPVLRMGNVTDDGRLDLSELKYMDLMPDEVPKYTVQPGDMLFNRTNSKEKVGKSAVVRTERPLAFAGYLVRVRFEDAATAEFVSAYLTSRHGQKVRKRMAKAAVNQANINASEMRGIAIAMPPLDLRSSFAKHLADTRIQRGVLERASAETDELFASLRSRAFRGEL